MRSQGCPEFLGCFSEFVVQQRILEQDQILKGREEGCVQYFCTIFIQKFVRYLYNIFCNIGKCQLIRTVAILEEVYS